MKKVSIFSAALLVFATLAAAKPTSVKVVSPDGRIALSVDLDQSIGYTVSLGEKVLLSDPAIGMHLQNGQVLGENPKLAKKKVRQINEVIAAPFHRNAQVKNECNELDLRFKGNYGVIFRAYDNGVAYRFYTTMKDSIVIASEEFAPVFPADYPSYLSYSTNPKKPMAMAFQNFYTEAKLSATDAKQLAFLPMALDAGNGVKLVFSESDLEAYPGMYIQPQPEKKSLKGCFAPYPKEMGTYPWRVQDYVVSAESYIARTQGTRTFPWRVWAISEKDTELPVNDLIYILASANRIGDTSWIKPGKVAWDWWNDWGLKGVDFKAGINTRTYKYYIDFASKHGLEYVVLDEGWYNPKSGDMLTVVPEINLPELVAYGKQKNVSIVLWTVFNVLNNQLEAACRKYADMGIKGFKVDFLDRDDQTAVERIYHIAEVTAQHHLFLDYHGFYKPTGLERTYPHIINFEGVFGMEEVKWAPDEKDMPRYDVTMPYLRMMCGPVDYTPGAMRNATKKDWKPMYYTPQSMGTRAHQAACYVVYDSPFTMLCDAPTEYEKEPEYTKFIASIPVVAEETKVLDGIMGEYIVTARRVGEDWYVGAMTNWDERTVDLPLTFLAKDKKYNVEILEDGINASKRAEDYRISSRKGVDASTTISLKMSSGGGCVLKIKAAH